MNNRHKYFRNLRYKQKLEARHTNYWNWHSGIYFITQEPDPRAVRESNNFYLRYPDTDPAEWEKVRGKDYYISWKRPEIPYSIKEYMHGRNGWKKLMKYQTARRNRRLKITDDATSPRAKSFYKKVEDIWNYD